MTRTAGPAKLKPVKGGKRRARRVPRRVVLPDRPPVQGLAEDITLYVNIEGREVPIPNEVLESLESVELERSIVQGSTLKLKTLDPNRNLQRAGYFTRVPNSKREETLRSDLLFDDLWFRCCNFEKNVDEYVLSAEDREIAMMREFTGPASSSAAQGSKNPRAIWVQKLVKFAGLNPHTQFFCPEIGKKPPVVAPIEKAATKKTTKQRGAAAKGMEIGGVGLDPDQRHNVEILMDVCDEKKAPRLARIAILCAAIGESTLRTITTPNSLGYWGVLQGGSGQKGSAPNFPNTPNAQVTKEMAESFLEGGRGFQAGGALHLISSGISDPGEIATKVEASGEPPNYYGKNKDDAEALITASGSEEATGSGAVEQSSYTPQRFFQLPQNEKSEAEEPEGAWENAETYSNEVDWRLFCMSGVVHFVSDEYLEKQVPVVEGLDETTKGVTDIKWQIDARKKINPPTLEIDARCPMWFAPPGSSIVMGDRNGTELHEGIWLVSSIHRPDITDNAVTITLERPKSPLPETALAKVYIAKPIASTTPGEPSGHSTRDGGTNSGAAQPTDANGVPKAAMEVFFNAQYIAGYRSPLFPTGVPYLYGGGHGATFGPSAPTQLGKSLGELGFAKGTKINEGLDCSGAVSWCLGGGSANLLEHPYDTTGLEYWGAEGIGKYFTVWVRSVPDGHTFLEFTLPGYGPNGAGSPISTVAGKEAPIIFVAHQPGTIVGFGSESHAASTGNWKPRHWPGC
jgi:hypothetical protein